MYSFFPKKYLLADRYLIEKQLGQGGFGITYKAYDEKLKKTVCIKELFISGNSTRSENFSVQSQSVGNLDFEYFKTKFLEEAQKMASFNHPSIVRVLDFFEANNTAYMVMDFIEGQNLKQSIETTGALAEEEAMNYMLQLLDAVELVHKQNILHRDIKPENILITKDKRVVLIDFGTAKFQATDNETTQIKNSTIAVLSPKYAPPEQYNTESQKGAFTDIYSLGATLYFLLTNQEPPDVNSRAIDGIKNPKQIMPSISKHVDAAVMKAINLKPRERFQSVAEFREALNRVEDEGVSDFENYKKSTIKSTDFIEDINNVILIIFVVSILFITLFGIISIFSKNNTNSRTEEVVPSLFDENTFVEKNIENKTSINNDKFDEDNIHNIKFYFNSDSVVFINFDSVLYIDDTLKVYYIIENSDANFMGPTNFNGFKILSGPNQSSSFQWIQGKTIQKKEHCFILLAEKEGVHELPIGVWVKKDGKKVYSEKASVHIKVKSSLSNIDNKSTNTVTDIDGNTYKTVKIGDQVWMAENLNVSRFRNGDPIPHAKTAEEWKKAGENKQPSWCYYGNDPANGIKYGKLYNWYAVNDTRGLAPKGWHVPTDAELNGNYESGFSGLPGGLRDATGTFNYFGENGFWWSSTEDVLKLAWGRSSTWSGNYYKENGFSVRCLRD